MGSDDYESGFDDAADDVTDDHHGGDIFFPAHSVSASQLKAADFVSIAGVTASPTPPTRSALPERSSPVKPPRHPSWGPGRSKPCACCG